jgi:hypothetical protein
MPFFAVLSRAVPISRSEVSLTHRLVRFLLLLSLALSAAFLVPPRDGVWLSGAAPGAAAAAPQAQRTVFLVGDLSEENQIAFLANLAASGHRGVPLFDTPDFSKYLRAFLDAYEAETIVPVGAFPGGLAGLQLRLGTGTTQPLDYKHGP